VVGISILISIWPGIYTHLPVRANTNQSSGPDMFAQFKRFERWSRSPSQRAGFGSAGGAPAGLRRDTSAMTAGGTPALQNLREHLRLPDVGKAHEAFERRAISGRILLLL